jgi:hypothetical protein
MAWKEDHESREFIEQDISEVTMKKGSVITKEDIIALRTGEITGEELVARWTADGKLGGDK